MITNNAGGTIITTGSKAAGIFGYALAEANAGDAAYYATGGVASATTTVNNYASITSKGTALYQGAKAHADGYGSYAGVFSSGTGGTAIAGVTIVNHTGGTLSSSKGYGIDGLSLASANAQGTYAFGGTASATTTITNSAPITFGKGSGIYGGAKAFANADHKGSSGYSATGGTAVAGVVITNNAGGAIVGSGSKGAGIFGYALAAAIAGDDATHALGGTANATTTITNYAPITMADNKGKGGGIGIYGGAKAAAHGYGSYVANGNGTGGTAVAGVLITNNAGGTISTNKGNGIDGYSLAGANAQGYFATGGTASATTTIENSAPITTAKGDGIYGGAKAFANADHKGSAGYYATGGTAVAGVVITNNAGGTILSMGSGSKGVSLAGIFGYSLAAAIAGDDATHAYGGFASATTTINNYAPVTTLGDNKGPGGDSIYGGSKANASAYGSYTGSGSATGGTAVAGIVITNHTGGTLSSSNAEGIDGYSAAKAIAEGHSATGGTANATTTITNFAAITSWLDGIYGGAKANGSAYARNAGSYASGGTATAGVVITNNTGGTISSINGEGIDGYSHAKAIASGKDGLPSQAIGGTANATTTITNFASIVSYNDGIYGGAHANTSAYATTGGSATGGTSVADVFITNAGEISVKGIGEGIDGNSQAKAIAGGAIQQYGIFGVPYTNAGTLSATGGTAIATTTILNAASGSILTYAGDGIDGIAHANANAYGSPYNNPLSFASGGFASATVAITNHASIGALGGYSGAAETGLRGRTGTAPGSRASPMLRRMRASSTTSTGSTAPIRPRPSKCGPTRRWVERRLPRRRSAIPA